MKNTIIFVSLLAGIVFIFILYLSIGGPKNFKLLDYLVKNEIEKNIDGVQISSIQSGILFDWNEKNLLLSLNKLDVQYNRQFSIKVPSINLKISIINLLLNKKNKIINGVTFLEQKFQLSNIKNHSKLSNTSKIKIPIDLLKKYKSYLENTDYSIDDFNFGIKLEDGIENNIEIKNFNINLGDFTSGFNGKIISHMILNGYEFDINVTLLEKKDYIDLNGILEAKNNDNKITFLNSQIDTGYQINISSQLKYLNFVEKVKFQFKQSNDGYVSDSNFVDEPIKFNDLIFDGEINNNFSSVNILDLQGNIDDKVNINGNMKYSANNFSMNVKFKDLSVSKFLEKWSSSLLPNVRKWLSIHLKSGAISSLDLKKDKDTPMTTSINMKSVNIKYGDSYPRILLGSAAVKFSKKSLFIYSEDAKIIGNNIKTISAKIDDFQSNNIVMKFSALIEGLIVNQLNIAKAHHKLPKLPNIKGTADTKITFQIPLQKHDFKFYDLKLDINSNLNKVCFQDPDNLYSLNDGDFKLKFLDQELSIDGNANINKNLHTDIHSKFFLNKEKEYTIKLKSKASVKDLQKSNIPFSNYFSGITTIDAVVKSNSQAIETDVILNLDMAFINLDAIAVVKRNYSPSKITFKLIDDRKSSIEIKDFLFSLPTQSFKGDGIIDKKTSDITYFTSNILQKNMKGFNIKYENSNETKKITINGIEANLSELNIGQLITFVKKNNANKQESFSLVGNIKSIKLKNNIVLKNNNMEITSSPESNKLEFLGELENKKIVKLHYNYPIFVFISENAGEILKGFGITEKINDGQMEIRGEFQKDKMFNGNIVMGGFYAQRMPFLLNLLTLDNPFSTINNMMKNKGLYFQDCECAIKYNNKLNVIYFDNCLAKSQQINLKINGNIDLNKQYLNSQGVVIPQNIINKVSSKIPLLNIISGSKNEGLIMSTLFDLNGPINKELKLKINYLSTFTPGVIRDIMKKKEINKEESK
ncbi:MAG: hypothetical protein ACI8ZF_000047 [Candidatus Midichloriaceae bacterium]